MTVKRMSNLRVQYDDGNGVLASNYRLFFYAAGSSTKQNTYNSSTGGVANANPIVLNALGEPASEIWLTAGQSYKVGLAIPGVDDPPASFIWTEDNIAGVNDTTTTIDEWVGFAGVSTFVSATSFTLVGDQTTEFHVGRRLKTINSGGTVYGTIIASAFAASTTVTVVNDAGVLDAGLSAVSYGLIRANNTSEPLLVDTFPLRSGSSDKTKKMRIELDGNTTATTRVQTPPDYDHRVMSQTHGADIASAGTLNLDTATGDLVDVTGTTSITAITLADGKMATVRFTGSLTLTNGASLVLPGAVNIQTAAGDFAVFRGYAAGVVRLVDYRFAATPLGLGAGLVKLATGAASGATLDIVMTAYTGFANKLLVFDLIPVSDGVGLSCRVSTDGGSTYDAGAANYGVYLRNGDDNVGDQTSSFGTGTAITGASVIGFGAAEGVRGHIRMINTTSTALWPSFIFDLTYVGNNGTPQTGWWAGQGARRNAQDTDGFRMFFTSGNIASGSWTLYGYN